MTQPSHITSVMKERRVFKPRAAFSRQAHIPSLATYRKLYRAAERDPQKFWAGIARDLHWFKTWRRTLSWKEPFAQWFVGGRTNLSYNCLDRHLSTARKNKAAIIWEGEPGDTRVLTYQDLHREVCRFAATLTTKLGVKTGDRVAIYMPMVPEAAIAMLACARIGAVHSVVF